MIKIRTLNNLTYCNCNKCRHTGCHLRTTLWVTFVAKLTLSRDINENNR